MKLVVFGLTISSSWGNGHATLWRGLCRALSASGHRVVFYERDTPYYRAHRDLRDSAEAGCDLRLYTAWPAVRSEAGREVASADAAMVTSYCPDGVPATELVAERCRGIRCFYDLDAPVTLARLRAGQQVDYLGPRGLSDFDTVLSFTGGSALTELAERLGARRVAALYGSVDPAIHRPVPPSAGYQCHLSYLGTWAQDRQAALDALMLEPARRMPGRKFLIGGSQYPQDFPWAENIWHVPHVPPADHPAFYCSGRMTLNVTRGAMAEMGWCPSGRLFEAAACGAPILSDYWAGLDEFFEPGREILVARDTEEALEAMSRSDDELAVIARAARQRALGQHSSRHRAEQLVALLGGRNSEATPRDAA